MLKLRHAFRRFANAARIGAAVFLFAGPAWAYTMQDYYNARAVVEADNWLIADWYSAIATADHNIQSTNDWYSWQHYQCGMGAGHTGPTGQSQYNAMIECQDSNAMEWMMVLSGYEADKAAAETGLWMMQLQLANDQGTLAQIKAELGIVD